MKKVLREVENEMKLQFEKWGEQNHPDGTGAPKFRLDLEYYRRLNKRLNDEGTLHWRAVLGEEFYEALCEADPEKLREELVQVAAVACSWIESIDRRGNS